MIYELKAGGVDERRLVGVKLEKLAEGETGMLCSNSGRDWFLGISCRMVLCEITVIMLDMQLS